MFLFNKISMNDIGVEFFFCLQVSVSKARAIIVLASDENADQVSQNSNFLMLLNDFYYFLWNFNLTFIFSFTRVMHVL